MNVEFHQKDILHLLRCSCNFLLVLFLFFLSFVNVVYHFGRFVDIENPYIPGINHTWSWYILPLIYCWIQFASIMLRFWILCSLVILACNFICVISLSFFGVTMMDTSQNEFGSVPFSAIFWISFRMIGVNCSLKEARIYNGKKDNLFNKWC